MLVRRQHHNVPRQTKLKRQQRPHGEGRKKSTDTHEHYVATATETDVRATRGRLTVWYLCSKSRAWEERGVGVERPLSGGEVRSYPPRQREAIASRLPEPTLLSSSSARCSVDSFSSWISLQPKTMKTIIETEFSFTESMFM